MKKLHGVILYFFVCALSISFSNQVKADTISVNATPSSTLVLCLVPQTPHVSFIVNVSEGETFSAELLTTYAEGAVVDLSNSVFSNLLRWNVTYRYFSNAQETLYRTRINNGCDMAVWNVDQSGTSGSCSESCPLVPQPLGPTNGDYEPYTCCLEFSESFYTGGWAIMSAYQSSASLNYINVFFQEEVVNAIAVTVICSFAVSHFVWLSERGYIKKPGFIPRLYLFNSKYLDGLRDGVWFAMATVLGDVGSGSKIPKGPIGRLLFIVWCLFGTMVMAYITSLISSTLTNSLMNVSQLSTAAETVGRTLCFSSVSGERLWNSSYTLPPLLNLSSSSSAAASTSTYRVPYVLYDTPSECYAALRNGLADVYFGNREEMIYFFSTGQGIDLVVSPTLKAASYSLAWPVGWKYGSSVNAALQAYIEGLEGVVPTYSDSIAKWYFGDSTTMASGGTSGKKSRQLSRPIIAIALGTCILYALLQTFLYFLECTGVEESWDSDSEFDYDQDEGRGVGPQISMHMRGGGGAYQGGTERPGERQKGADSSGTGKDKCDDCMGDTGDSIINGSGHFSDRGEAGSPDLRATKNDFSPSTTVVVQNQATKSTKTSHATPLLSPTPSLSTPSLFAPSLSTNSLHHSATSYYYPSNYSKPLLNAPASLPKNLSWASLGSKSGRTLLSAPAPTDGLTVAEFLEVHGDVMDDLTNGDEDILGELLQTIAELREEIKAMHDGPNSLFVLRSSIVESKKLISPGDLPISSSVPAFQNPPYSNHMVMQVASKASTPSRTPEPNVGVQHANFPRPKPNNLDSTLGLEGPSNRDGSGGKESEQKGNEAKTNGNAISHHQNNSSEANINVKTTSPLNANFNNNATTYTPNEERLSKITAFPHASVFSSIATPFASLPPKPVPSTAGPAPQNNPFFIPPCTKQPSAFHLLPPQFSMSHEEGSNLDASAVIHSPILHISSSPYPRMIYPFSPSPSAPPFSPSPAPLSLPPHPFLTEKVKRGSSPAKDEQERISELISSSRNEDAFPGLVPLQERKSESAEELITCNDSAVYPTERDSSANVMDDISLYYSNSGMAGDGPVKKIDAENSLANANDNDYFMTNTLNHANNEASKGGVKIGNRVNAFMANSDKSYDIVSTSGGSSNTINQMRDSNNNSISSTHHNNNSSNANVSSPSFINDGSNNNQLNFSIMRDDSASSMTSQAQTVRKKNLIAAPILSPTTGKTKQRRDEKERKGLNLTNEKTNTDISMETFEQKMTEVMDF